MKRSRRMNTSYEHRHLVNKRNIEKACHSSGIVYGISGVSGYPRAWYIRWFREFESPRVYTRNSWGFFLAHKLTCGKRESVSLKHPTKYQRAVRLLNPMRDKIWRQEPGGRRDDTCNHVLPGSWKVEVCEKKKWLIWSHRFRDMPWTARRALLRLKFVSK